MAHAPQKRMDASTFLLRYAMRRVRVDIEAYSRVPCGAWPATGGVVHKPCMIITIVAQQKEYAIAARALVFKIVFTLVGKNLVVLGRGGVLAL